MNIFETCCSLCGHEIAAYRDFDGNVVGHEPNVTNTYSDETARVHAHCANAADKLDDAKISVLSARLAIERGVDPGEYARTYGGCKPSACMNRGA